MKKFDVKYTAERSTKLLKIGSLSSVFLDGLAEILVIC